jgi:hypothetical protein
LRKIRRLIEWVLPVNICALIVKALDGLKCLRRSLADLADAVTNEQQILRIYMACFYEPAGLFGASAGVRLVYQSALIVHEITQIPASAGQSLAKALAGYFQHLGGDGVGHPEDLAEDVAQALLPIEA